MLLIFRQRTWIIKAAVGGMIGVVILIGIIAITVTLTGKTVVELLLKSIHNRTVFCIIFA